MEVWSESLWAMLEYWYVEHGLLQGINLAVETMQTNMLPLTDHDQFA